MNQGQFSGAVKMGVGIGDRYSAVSRPAGMTDTHTTLGKASLTDRDLADLLLQPKPTPAFDRNTPGIVTAIFKFL